MSSNFWSSSHCQYWLISRTHLNASRSVDLQYATPRQIYCLNIWFANLIQKLGKRLLLRQIPIATATVFFRRFYLKNSFCETNPFLVLAACCFVAAKVEETPVHIKSVVQEAKMVFSEFGNKMFPADTNKLGEMEFYLMEDLDFHLTIFHPYRSLLHMLGREPADPGKFPQSRVDEDAEIKKKEADQRRKKEEEARRAGPASLGVARVNKALDELASGKWEEGEERRIRRLMGRGSGEGLMEIDEGVLQICLFLINDTYRTDVHLLYPPYVISLAVLYIGFCLTAMNNPTGARTRSSSSQINSLPNSLETNEALGLPPPPQGAAEFIASFEVSLPVLLACVQDIIVLYPIWEAFEPTSRPNQNTANVSGGGHANAMSSTATLAAAAAALGRNNGDKKDATKEKFGPEEADTLVRRMIEQRAIDLSRPDPSSQRSDASSKTDALSPSLAGKKRARH